MTMSDNPMTTAWNWVARAPLPVALALLFILAGWTRAVDEKASEALGTSALALESKREQSRKLEKIDEKLDALLVAIAQIQAEQKQAEKAANKVASDLAAKEKKK